MKSLVVSVCITAVTDMAAVSLLVFFWCSSGVRGNSRKNEVALETPNTPPRAGSLLP